MDIDRMPPLPPPILVGEHLAMDFLNSSATPSGERVEWLRDGAGLLDWLEHAGAIDAAAAATFWTDRKARSRLDSVAAEARHLRAWLRAFVEKHAGRDLRASAAAELAPLNRLLEKDSGYWQIEARTRDVSRSSARSESGSGSGSGGALQQRRVRRWTMPEDLLQPIGDAIADLVCHADFRLIRACEGAACTLMFLDRTKAHGRRWCSMAVCGNRAKAAAHRARAARRSA
jgi:predicted RNA-binding Zn ribbon-like protein